MALAKINTMPGKSIKAMDSNSKIATVGEILVEMMSTEPGQGFLEPQTIIGPFPSGAPAIFIDQIAKMGIPCSMVGSVGDDDFGTVNIHRLQQDGVDISAINVSHTRATGIAFVRYRPDGQRDFLFTLDCCAADQISTTHIKKHLRGVSHLHVVGSSLTMNPVAKYISEAIPIVKACNGTISFDPNVRPEIMQDPAMATLLDSILWSSDLVLPSAGELTYFCDAETDDQAIAQLLERGVPEIVLKQGRDGASRHTVDGVISQSGFEVTEVDPTGAGDCFGAAYVACRCLGQSPEYALEHACAAGALAVVVQGPMEGTSTLETIRAFVKKNANR